MYLTEVVNIYIYIFDLEFSIQIVKNPFTGSRYFFDDTVDYSGNTELEYDVES